MRLAFITGPDSMFCHEDKYKKQSSLHRIAVEPLSRFLTDVFMYNHQSERGKLLLTRRPGTGRRAANPALRA